MKRLWILLAALCCMLALFSFASVLAEDALPEYPISLDIPDAWPAGKNLSITWTPLEDATNQYMAVNLVDPTNGVSPWSDYSFEAEPQTFVVPGCYLQSGTYTLAVSAGADSYSNPTRNYSLTITDNPGRPATPEITLNDSPSSVTPIYHFNLGRSYDRYYAELYEQDEESGWALYREKISESWDDTSAYLLYGQLHAGQWKVEISVLDGDTWSLPGALSFTVAQAPKLAEAELAESIGNIGLNSRFSIKLQPVENAGWYNAVLQSELSGENVASSVYYVNESNPPEVITLTFNSWDETAEPGAYRIKVTARDIEYEYEDSVTEFTNLTVYQTETPAAPTEVYQNKAGRIPMTAEERANVVINSYLRVTVTYPQVMQAVEYELSGALSDSFTYELVEPDTTWYHDALRMLYRLGDHSFRVRVLTNNLWSEWSEPIAFTVVPPPQLSKPTVVPDKTAFTLGEDLTLTITDIDPEATNLSVEAGTFSETFYRLAEPLVITIPQEYFSTDTNQVLVAASASGHSSGVTTFEITVSGEAPAAPTVAFSATTGAYMETIYADVAAPDATEVCMDMYGSYSYQPARNGAARVPIQIFGYAPRRLQVRFRALVNGIWSEWTEYTSITFPARPAVAGGQEWVILPEEIIPGQDMEITLLPAEGISTYQINFYSSLHPSEYINESIMFSKTYDHPGVIRIPAAAFAESGRYWFHNCAGIPGAPDLFVKGSKTYQVETYSGENSLTISTNNTNLAYLEKTTISLGDVQASQVLWEWSKVNEPGSTADPWLALVEYDVPEGETVSSLNISFDPYGGGDYSVRVMAQVDGVWTAWSNSLTFHVSPRENGKLRNPVPQAAESVPAGQPLRVIWEAAEHAESYTVTWSENGKFETTELFAEIPTAGLEPGEYSVSVKSSARGYENDRHFHYAFFEVTEPQAVLNVSVDKQSYDYGDRIEMTAAITNPDGTTEGLAEQYPDALIEATLVDENGEPVSGFIVQSSNGLTMSTGFPLANDGMPAGQYRIRVETNVAGLTAETELFEYTAVRPDMSVLSECSVELTLNTDVFSLDEPFKMTASVTDKAGNPVKGVKVGFMILDSEGNLFYDFFSYDWIWNVTRPDGQCSLTVTVRTGEGQVLRPASYQVKLFIVDMEEICDIKPFEFRLESLYLPDSLTAIEAEAFAGTDSQAVFVPEGCTSIGERAFADCSQLYYIHIPAGVTDIADNAFEGCPDCLWIDRE